MPSLRRKEKAAEEEEGETALKLNYRVSDRIASFGYETDLPSTSWHIHPSGILHASRSMVDGREKHKFVWIDDSIHVESVLARLERDGFDDAAGGDAVFVPYSSKRNWRDRYPHAAPTLECKEDGAIHELPNNFSSQECALGERGAVDSVEEEALSEGNPAPEEEDSEPNSPIYTAAERDQLHVEIYDYLSWMHEDLAEDRGTKRLVGWSQGAVDSSELGKVVVSLASAFAVTARIEPDAKQREERPFPGRKRREPFLEWALVGEMRRIVSRRTAERLEGKQTSQKQTETSDAICEVEGMGDKADEPTDETTAREQRSFDAFATFVHPDGVRRLFPSDWEFPRSGTFLDAYLLWHAGDASRNVAPMKRWSKEDMKSAPSMGARGSVRFGQLRPAIKLVDDAAAANGAAPSEGAMTTVDARRCFEAGKSGLGIPAVTATGRPRKMDRLQNKTVITYLTLSKRDLSSVGAKSTVGSEQKRKRAKGADAIRDEENLVDEADDESTNNELLDAGTFATFVHPDGVQRLVPPKWSFPQAGTFLDAYILWHAGDTSLNMAPMKHWRKVDIKAAPAMGAGRVRFGQIQSAVRLVDDAAAANGVTLSEEAMTQGEARQCYEAGKSGLGIAVTATGRRRKLDKLLLATMMAHLSKRDWSICDEGGAADDESDGDSTMELDAGTYATFVHPDGVQRLVPADWAFPKEGTFLDSYILWHVGDKSLNMAPVKYWRNTDFEAARKMLASKLSFGSMRRAIQLVDDAAAANGATPAEEAMTTVDTRRCFEAGKSGLGIPAVTAIGRRRKMDRLLLSTVMTYLSLSKRDLSSVGAKETDRGGQKRKRAEAADAIRDEEWSDDEADDESTIQELDAGTYATFVHPDGVQRLIPPDWQFPSAGTFLDAYVLWHAGDDLLNMVPMKYWRKVDIKAAPAMGASRVRFGSIKRAIKIVDDVAAVNGVMPSDEAMTQDEARQCYESGKSGLGISAVTASGRRRKLDKLLLATVMAHLSKRDWSVCYEGGVDVDNEGDGDSTTDKIDAGTYATFLHSDGVQCLVPTDWELPKEGTFLDAYILWHVGDTSRNMAPMKYWRNADFEAARKMSASKLRFGSMRRAVRLVDDTAATNGATLSEEAMTAEEAKRCFEAGKSGLGIPPTTVNGRRRELDKLLLSTVMSYIYKRRDLFGAGSEAKPVEGTDPAVNDTETEDCKDTCELEPPTGPTSRLARARAESGLDTGDYAMFEYPGGISRPVPPTWEHPKGTIQEWYLLWHLGDEAWRLAPLKLWDKSDFTATPLIQASVKYEELRRATRLIDKKAAKNGVAPSKFMTSSEARICFDAGMNGLDLPRSTATKGNHKSLNDLSLATVLNYCRGKSGMDVDVGEKKRRLARSCALSTKWSLETM